MADKAYLTPKVLKWARESARIAPEPAAKRAGVSVEKMEEWESGTSQPTVRQAEELAKFYRRSFALFFLPDIPRDFQPLKDFRRAAVPLGTASLFIIREMQQKQAWLREAFEEGGEPPLPFVGRFSLRSDPRRVAADVLATLQIAPAAYTAKSPLREWIARAEANGIFISRTSFIHSHLKLDSDELQGFAIADPFAPFVFINSDDWDAPQLFTLVHEIAHLWIAQSGVSNHTAPEFSHSVETDPVELFCNQVAANALMPESLMRQLAAAAFASNEAVFQAAQKLGVSSFAFLVRALHLQLISPEAYRRLKRAADAAFREYVRQEEARKEREKLRKEPGGPNPYLLRLNKNGRLFTQVVLDAFRGGSIAPTQASNLLNTQINKIARFEALLQA